MNAARLASFFFITLTMLSGCQTEKPWWQTERSISSSEEARLGEHYFPLAIQQLGGEYQQAPALNQYVKKMGKRLAAQSQRPDLPYEFVVTNQDTPQIVLLPGGKIALSRGLLTEVHSGAELAAILGHQIAHAALHHTTSENDSNILLSLAEQLSQQRSEEKNAPAVLHPLLTDLTHQRYTIEQEIEADRFAAQYARQLEITPEGTLAFLQYLSTTPNIQSQHPITPERQLRAQYIVNQTISTDYSWELDSFETAVAALRAQAPAYALNQSAIMHLEKKEMKKAVQDIEKAIAEYPHEGLFYATLGKIHLANQAPAAAITDFNAAIARRTFYEDHALRGAAYLKIGKQEPGYTDLKMSQSLLPNMFAQDHLTLISHASKTPQWVLTGHPENTVTEIPD